MGCYKEEAFIFESVAKCQRQIYNDAADYGLPYNTKSLPIEIKQLIAAVNDLKPRIVKREADTVRQQWSNVVIHLPWEVDEGIECGTEYQVSFARSTGSTRFDKTCDAFISVFSKPYRKPYMK